jgi:NIPSNAP
MIFDLRIYTMHPGKLQSWLKLYEAHGLSIQTKHLGKPIMFATTEVGPLNQVIHLWGYASQGERETKRNAMVADPAWPEFLKKSAELGAAMQQENRILKSTSFSPL